MLEHSADLYNHLSSTQMPIAQNGYLDYNHQQWMDTQAHTVTPAHYDTTLCAHTCTLSHTQSHTCTLSHTQCTLSHTDCTLSHTHSHTPAHYHTHTVTYLHTITHTQSHTCTLSHTHSHTLAAIMFLLLLCHVHAWSPFSAAGGRDKNGGAIIVIQGSPQVEYRTLEVGKVLSYLIRIPPYVSCC